MPDTSASVAIVGAGPIGCATAAYLQARGHRPSMWSPNGTRMQRSGGSARIACTGALSTTVDVPFLQAPTDLAKFETVLICLPGNAYAGVLAPLADHWRSGQTLLVSGALSLCPLWLMDDAQSRGQSIQTAGWGTTSTTAHVLADGRLHVNPLRERIDLAALDNGSGARPAVELCHELLGDRFVAADNLLAPALANINPIAHAAEVIPNLSRMDRGETWSLFECFTPVVADMAHALDQERLAIASAFGFALPSLQEHYARSYHIAQAPLADMAAEIHRKGMSPNGPNRLDHRYVLEDVPFGLVFQEALAQMTGVATPALSASITLLQSIYGRDFRTENFLVRALSLRETDASSLRKRCAAASNAAMLSRRAALSR
jgi:opine dehydrogenase